MQQYFSTHNELFLGVLFFASILNALLLTMGGSGFLVLFMIMVGVPPAMALGTARVAALPGWVLAAKKFHQAGKIQKNRLFLISLLSVIAGVIGTYMIIGIDEKYIYPVVGTLLILIAPLSLANKNLGIVKTQRGPIVEAIGYVLFFLAMIYGGFLGNGASIMCNFIAIAFLGFRSLEAHATLMTSWIMMSLFSSIIFIYHGQINWVHAAVIFFGTLVGSHFGSHIAIKGGDKWVKVIVCLFSLIVGTKLLFFR